MPDQNTTPKATESTDESAFSIYEALVKEGFSTEDKIGVIKALSGLVRSDIDQDIKQLQALKQTF